MSDTEGADCGRSSPVHNGEAGGRREKSLGLLTTKFVDLLQGAEGGVLDLKKVSSQRSLPPPPPSGFMNSGSECVLLSLGCSYAGREAEASYL